MPTTSIPIPADISASDLQALLAQYGSMRATALAKAWALSSLHARCKRLGIASPTQRTGRPAVEEDGRAVDFSVFMGGGGGGGRAKPVAAPIAQVDVDEGDDGQAGGQAQVQ